MNTPEEDGSAHRCVNTCKGRLMDDELQIRIVNNINAWRIKMILLLEYIGQGGIVENFMTLIIEVINTLSKNDNGISSRIVFIHIYITP